MKNLLVIVALLMSSLLQAQLKKPVGKSDFSDWSGISSVGNNEASFKSGGLISYRYPDGKNYNKGFRKYYGNASDWGEYAGLSFEIYLRSESSAKIDISFKVAAEDAKELNPVSTAKIQLEGKGWQSVYVPWDIFDLNEGQRMGTLQAVKELDILANSPDNPILQIRNTEVTKGKMLSMESPVQGKSVAAGGKVHYEVEIGNTTGQKQKVQLMFAKYGWESMSASVEPSILELAPNEIKKCIIEVTVPSRLPKGVREKQVLKAIPNGKGSDVMTLEFNTAVSVPFPNIVFTSDKWQEVKDKIKKYDWAKQDLAEYEEKASKWEVPEIANKLSGVNTYMGRHLYHTNDADNMRVCATAYQLTGKKEYAEKCVLFLRRLTNLENGYPTTFRANGQNFVKEGGFFQDVARGYDMIYNSELLTKEDRTLIENTFRLYIKTIQLGTDIGGISNWDVSEVTGALYCALAIQDWHLVESLLHGPTGIYSQFSNGVMSDGWWYECAVGYNLWVASEFSEIAIALQPWGINFKDERMPIGTTPFFSLMPERKKAGLYGIAFAKWGAITKNSIGIKDMWNALLPFLDYRGVMFAVNDASETRVSGDRFELANYLYHDPEYAAVIKRGKKRDLLYGVPDLPNVTSEKMKESAYADNIGIVQLRSQTQGREQREQIQAALHYGSHGGHHGHFDRTNFVSMMRYGRSFYNPEMFWYGYASYLYKFLVQTSMTKNMVVVDQKMQEPKESFRKLFYTGEMMQAAEVETNARWSNPPYGGMRYSGKENTSLTDKTWQGNRSIYIPKDAPEYGAVIDFTEPVLQRRLMLMLDDYVVLADYLKASEEHTFDWLMQIKGFKEINADKKEFLRHDNQMSTDPLSSAQFITDCDWYKTDGTSRLKFEMCWGKGCDNDGARMPSSEDGPLKIDVFNAWPQQNQIMIGTAPENFDINKRLWYSVKADNQTLLNDSTGAWILGSKNIELDITGKKQLVLSTRTSRAKNNTIFWGNARLVLKDGSEVFVSSLQVKYKNIVIPASKGRDYYNGPIKIAGELMENSTPGMPVNDREGGTITIDLSGMNAVGFKAKLGGDFPLGNESSRRKTMAVRSQGKEARYLSVIEPYEKESAINSVKAKSANELEVELKDGRIQEITISDFESDTNQTKVSVRELLNGKVIREEQSH